MRGFIFNFTLLHRRRFFWGNNTSTMNDRLMLKTLHGKLSIALLAILFLVGLLHISLTFYLTPTYLNEVNQNLNRTLASDLAKHLIEKNLLSPDPQVRLQTKAEIKQNMVLNPDIEIYILDPQGAIVDYSGAPGVVTTKRVSLEPIRRFLAALGPLPIKGDDPRHPERQKIFSAARIPQNPKASGVTQGYIYIILGGERYDVVAAQPGRSYIVRLSTWSSIGSLSLAALAGISLFRFLTRRLRALTEQMEAFQQESEATGTSSPTPVNGTIAQATIADATIADATIANEIVAPSKVAVPGGAQAAVGRNGPHMSTHAAKQKQGGDEIERMRAVFMQMSERILSQKAQRGDAEARRRQAVTNISHDLRTPIAALQGYLETMLIKEGQLSPGEQRGYLLTAMKHSERLGKLVAELFELSKLDSHEMQPAWEEFSLPELVQDVAQQFALVAQKKRVQLETRFALDLPFVRADIGLIERALENLIENALRHTPPGGHIAIVLGVENEMMAVQVSDTGQGIAPEHLPHIFDRTYRAPVMASGEQVTGESVEGAGLGLAITKRIIGLHNSTIQASSTPGQGATFRFRLPLALMPRQ